MFNFFKKNTSSQDLEQDSSFNIELVAYALAYEVAIADGAIDNDELARIKPVSYTHLTLPTICSV